MASGTILREIGRCLSRVRIAHPLRVGEPVYGPGRAARLSIRVLPASLSTRARSNILSERRVTIVLVCTLRAGLLLRVDRIYQRLFPLLMPSRPGPREDKDPQTAPVTQCIAARYSSGMPSMANFLLQTIPKSMYVSVTLCVSTETDWPCCSSTCQCSLRLPHWPSRGVGSATRMCRISFPSRSVTSHCGRPLIVQLMRPQYYLSGFLAFFVIEMLANWGMSRSLHMSWN